MLQYSYKLFGGCKMKTGELIKERRLELAMTMRELALLVGVSEATISRWESGDIANMRRDKIAALARALRVPPAVLMDWEEYEKEKIEKYNHARALYDLALKADVKNVEIVMELLKKLEGVE
jgi:transcriptional regulator with XRE-family HTH domain